MSYFEAPTSFLVTSDPTVQITVYDATRTLRGQAEGSLRLQLLPGLYRVHFERGGRVHHEIVDHESSTDLKHDGPPWQSPAPFAGAATSHDYYVAPAGRFSVTDTAPPLGPGPYDSRLLVFVRRAARDGSPPRLPSEPVTLHDADGRQLAAITGDNAAINHAAGYVAFSCRATPGTYRLRGVRSQRDAAIVVPAGRAAQVFVADTGSLRLAELRLALVPVGARFDARSPIWGAMENVIAALRTPGRALPLAARLLLPDAVENDLCFGIVAAHLLWRSGDRPGLAAVMRHLTRYREVPDVAILEQLDAGSAWAYEPLRRSPPALSDTPPLLRASLTLAMTRPELDPGTLSAYSAFAHAARTAVHDSVWCIWSTRTWDERWIEPAVERLRDHGQRDTTSIARSLALATETVEQSVDAIDARMPSVLGKPLDASDVVVPGYTLDKVLGRGARSIVYRARRQADHQEVALKIVPVLGGADGCARAHGELDRCPQADHPQLLAATARGTLPGDTGIWLEMELCHGSVLDLLSEQDAPLALPEAHRLVLEALAVLAYLHERGIAHGDLKPANLLARADRSVVITGIGLSASRALAAAIRHATDDPRLAPPELLSSDEPPDPACDVWAIAATYYLMLTLEYPRDEYAHQSPLEAALGNSIVSLARRRPDLPPALIRHIDAALSAARDARPRNAGAFRQQLASIDLAAPGESRVVGPAEPVRGTSAGRADQEQPTVWSAADDAQARGTEHGHVTKRDVHPPAGAHDIASTERDVATPHKRWTIRSLLPDLHTTRGRFSVATAIFAVAVIGLLAWSVARPSSYSCQQESQFGDLWYRSTACLASYRRTGNEHDLALAANAYLAVGALDTADQLAHQLLAGSRQGDAYSILGQIALHGGNIADATRYAELAREAHTRSADDHGVTEDAVLQSRVSARRSDFTAALHAADDAFGGARQLHDRHAEVAALLSRGDVLRALGDVHGAEATFMDAFKLADEPCDQARNRLRRGLYLMDTKQTDLAMAELVATERDQACGDRGISDAVALNQAWLLRSRDPVAAAAKLDALALSSGEQPESLLLRSYLAADRGDLAAADRDLDRAEHLDASDPDLRWRIEWAHAEVSEQRGDALDDALAEHYYRQSIARIAAVRTASPAWSAYLISSRRGPYDGLIALLARQGRWRDALAIVLDLDASDMLRAVANERIALDHADPSVPAPRAVALPPPQVDDVLSAWRAHDLVIAIAPSGRQIGAGHERAYRLRILDGEVTGEAVGDAALARRLAETLFAEPDDRAAARSLGSMMVPPGSDTSTLCVLAIGPLSRAPLPALRNDAGSLIISRRPLVRVRALAATRPLSRGAGRPVIIADPRGALPGAAAEGAIVARAAGPGALLAGSGTSIAATRSLLWTARDAALLHVAGDAATLGRWRVLPLADDAVTPPEVIQHGLAPRIAVLSTSDSVAASDEEGWGSFASALLESGTETVIVTDRRIEDRTALAVMRAFYAQDDWATDPARALARTQAKLDPTTDGVVPSWSSWAAFSVLRRPPFIARRAVGGGSP